MLQVNPNRRLSSEDLLKNDIILKKQNLNKVENKNKNNNEHIEPPATLLATIKLPKNFAEINQRLPKTKHYAKENR